jgi:hypothetical protein
MPTTYGIRGPSGRVFVPDATTSGGQRVAPLVALEPLVIEGGMQLVESVNGADWRPSNALNKNTPGAAGTATEGNASESTDQGASND